MKRLLIIAVLFVLATTIALSQAKPGGVARQAAMGGSQVGSGLVLNPYIFDDPALLFVNPAFQAPYHDYVWSNIGGGAINGQNPTGYGYQNAGVGFMLNDNWTLGAIFSYDPSMANEVRSLANNFADASIPSINNVWELIAATKVGDMQLGFGLSYGNSNTNEKHSVTAGNTEMDQSARLIGLRAGTLFDLGNSNVLDAAIAYRMSKGDIKNTETPATPGTNYEYSASGSELQIDARLKYKVSEKFNFVPFAFLASLSAEPKEDTPPNGSAATTVSDKFTTTAFGVGLGGEVRTKSLFLAGGLSFQTLSSKEEYSTGGTTPVTTTYTDKYTAIPVVNLGAEWSFTDWLAGRVGYFRYIGSVNHKRESGTTTDEWSTTGYNSHSNFSFDGVNSGYFTNVGALNSGSYDGIVTLGVGMKFGNWAMDATVSDQALQRGLGLIGDSDQMNTFGYITASYNFAE